MKKISFIISLLIVSITYGQLGLSVGYGSAKAKVSGSGVSINTESMSAISLGLVYDSNISENFDLQPYFSFGIGEKIEGESNNGIAIGTHLQFYPSKETLGLFFGPRLGYSFSLEDIDTTYSKKGGFGIGFQFGYDFSENITAIIQYSKLLTNMSKIDGIKVKSDSFGLTVQYKFEKNTAGIIAD